MKTKYSVICEDSDQPTYPPAVEEISILSPSIHIRIYSNFSKRNNYCNMKKGQKTTVHTMIDQDLHCLLL